MFIKNYEYIIPTIDNGDYYSIDGLTRGGIASNEFIKKTKPVILSRKTAVLYVGGFTISQSESRDATQANKLFRGSIDIQKPSMVIKESTAYGMHNWIGSMQNNQLVVYASITSNTCASSMYSLYEAQRLLNEGVCEEVVIIAEEKTSFNTLRIFKEHRVDLKCGDAFAMVTLTNKETPLEVTDTKWAYMYERNPFKTSTEGYALVDTECATIKPHGTGTPSNDSAEELITADRDVIKYKPMIGHTQGVSALVELCMAIDDASVPNELLCVASGLGGFYGSCVLHKGAIDGD